MQTTGQAPLVAQAERINRRPIQRPMGMRLGAAQPGAAAYANLDANTIRFVESFIAHVEAVISSGDAARGRVEQLGAALTAALLSPRKSATCAWRNVYLETGDIVDIAGTHVNAGESHSYLAAFLRENVDLLSVRVSVSGSVHTPVYGRIANYVDGRKGRETTTS